MAPTAPAAAETTSVSPALAGPPTSSRPKYAVMPGMPTMPSQRGSGTSDGSILVHAFGRRDRERLHAGHAGHEVAGGERRVVRLDDLADAAGAHHLADADRRHVRLGVVEPAAHRRIERHILDGDERLARRRRRHRRGHEFEVLARRPSPVGRARSFHCRFCSAPLTGKNPGSRSAPGTDCVLGEVGDALLLQDLLVDAEVAGELAARLGEDRVGRVGHDLGRARAVHRRVAAEQVLHRRGRDHGARPDRVDGDAVGRELAPPCRARTSTCRTWPSCTRRAARTSAPPC